MEGLHSSKFLSPKDENILKEYTTKNIVFSRLIYSIGSQIQDRMKGIDMLNTIVAVSTIITNLFLAVGVIIAVFQLIQMKKVTYYKLKV